MKNRHHILDLKKVVMVFFLLACSIINGQSKEKVKKEFPKPEGVKDLLFYVQRTYNTNTLIYTLNLNDKEEPDVKEPIKVNWINYSKDGAVEGLNFIQRKYAYGVDVKMVDAEKKIFAFNFVSYKKKSIYLIKSTVDNKYHAFYSLKNELIILNRIFIQIEGGSFWTPKVKYIDVSGVDMKGEEVSERVIP